MGLIGFRCPQSSQTAGKEVDFVTCLHCQNECLPVMLRAGIIRSHQYRGTGISATTITGCLRQTFLSRTQDYYAAPTALIYSAFRGSMVHQILETLSQGNFGGRNIQVDLAIDEVMHQFITEKRFYKNFPLTPTQSVEVSGQVDIYHKPTCILYDYKTMADKGIYYLAKGLKEAHIIQTNFYRWLLQGILPVKKIIIHYISMSTVCTTGKHIVFIDRSKDKSFDLPDVPMMTEQEFIKKVRPKVAEIHEAFEDGVPPTADGGEGGWLCKNCEFKSGCDWYGKNVLTSEVGAGNGKEAPVEVVTI